MEFCIRAYLTLYKHFPSEPLWSQPNAK